MSYFITTEYEIIPLGSYRIWHNCAGCGGKEYFRNTGSFRINANGSKIDVWLIYQCEKCRHTYNLTVYERTAQAKIGKEEYRLLLANDEGLAFRCGNDKMLFRKNRVQTDMELRDFTLRKKEGRKEVKEGEQIPGDQIPKECRIHITNPMELRVRTDKAAACLLQTSRSRIRQWVKEGKLEIIHEFAAASEVIIIRDLTLLRKEGGTEDADSNQK